MYVSYFIKTTDDECEFWRPRLKCTATVTPRHFEWCSVVGLD